MMRATFVGPGVAQRAAYLASEQQVKEWLRDGERGPAPTEYTTAKMAAAASSRRGAGGEYKRKAPEEIRFSLGYVTPASAAADSQRHSPEPGFFERSASHGAADQMVHF